MVLGGTGALDRRLGPASDETVASSSFKWRNRLLAEEDALTISRSQASYDSHLLQTMRIILLFVRWRLCYRNVGPDARITWSGFDISNHRR